MPEMDGIEAAAIIKKFDSDIPIIALTANAVSGTREMYLKNGFNDFLSKPINTLKLNSILEKWIPVEKQERNVKKTSTSKEQDLFDLTIEGIDVRKGISMTGGKLNTYLSVLAVFHKDGFERIEKIKLSLLKEDLKLFTIDIHAIKGACASIGALDISKEAKMLEDAGHNKDIDFIKKYIPGFFDNFEKILENIGNVIAEN
jgi:HPt (histidine-containing phosphotransfer) domain-containing protein